MNSEEKNGIVLAYVTERDIEHPEKEATIWRFMDITKFLSLLQKKALYFSRVGVIAEKFDPYEGKYPEETFEAYRREGDNLAKLANEPSMSDMWYRNKTEIRKIMSKDIHDNMYINCWHINEYDTNFMWELYTDRRLGIAIKSTYGRLENSLKDCGEEVHITKIKYGEKIVSTKSLISALVNKRIQFKEENELRAIIMKFDRDRNKPDGLHIKVDLNELIESVYLRPKSPDYVINIIKNILLKYDIDKKVEKSSIDAPPHY